AYNAGSGALALMTADNRVVYDALAAKLAASPKAPLTDKETELLTQLKYGRFAFDDDVDERTAMQFRHNLDRYDQTTLGLTIAPTLACNMACPYCYESNKQGRMSAETVEALIAYVEKRAPGLQGISVTWYGGEPLLALDIVEDLSTSFMDIGKETKTGYAASIISNGYLLTPETVDKLIQWQVGSVQVTVDGPARLHNVKRPLKNGRDSFDTILANLAYAVTKMKVSVRVNIDKTYDRDVIVELLGELKAAGLHDKIGLYFGQIEPSAQVCANIVESCFETADFSRVETEYFRLLLEHGFRVDKLPAPSSTFCMAQMVNSFLVDPQGELYRCFNHVGNAAKSMGNIRNEINYSHPNFRRLFAFDPFQDPRCFACNLLPVCMGGCPSRRTERDLSVEQLCESWKHNLQPMLEIIARSRQAEQQQKAAAAKENV
ncbi:MAG: radical SAM protein, partial [candidate division Zixibacteria bacterium]|nr:radical SAM protein [candidate division Zixibacteria bacterium]